MRASIESADSEEVLKHLRNATLTMLTEAPEVLQQGGAADGGGFIDETALRAGCLGDLLLFLLDTFSLLTVHTNDLCKKLLPPLHQFASSLEALSHAGAV